MRTDIGHGAEDAAQFGLEPPVPVGVEQQPVLQVMAGHQSHLAQRALADHAMHVLDDRVETQIEVGRVHQPTVLGHLEQVG